ncbi:MAG: hypothetical protein QGF53_06865 [Alphaproteobacteria bacterium]|nr:hypothetical protein [Alphaproteobacteria bacterium]
MIFAKALRGDLEGGTLAALIYRPWYDTASLPLLVRYFFPLSRAWAAAVACRGDAACFVADFPGRPAPSSLVLRHVAACADAHDVAEAAWRQRFFGDEPSGLEAADRKRRRASFRLMARRSTLLGAHLRRPFPSVRYAVEPPEAAAAKVRPAPFALSETPPVIERSHAIARPGGGRRFWIRFSAPHDVTDDTCWVRIDEPAGEPAATVVFAHGICMEDEAWDAGLGAPERLAQSVRVISPEGPWHGRRRLEGHYGGEPILARGPAGLADYFAAHIRELGHLIAWARETYGSPVGLFGISLGALTSQLVLTAARDWPAAARPDAALLTSSGESIDTVVFNGSLTAGLGVAEALSGWQAEDLDRMRPLLDPEGPPATDVGRIVIVLGERDVIVPFESGIARAKLWGIPPENLFVRNQGHFGVSLGLTAAPAPLERFVALLRQAA